MEQDGGVYRHTVDGESVDDEEGGNEDSENEGSDPEEEEEEEVKAPGVSDAVMQALEEMTFARCDRYGVELFTKEEEHQIKLIEILKRLKAPLKAFSEIMKWSKESAEMKFRHGSAKTDRPSFMQSIIDRLKTKSLLPKQKEFILPTSKEKVQIVYHDAAAMIASVLSDIEIVNDETLLFHNDDPFEPPPKFISTLGDINSGRCYQKSYEAVVKDPTREALLLYPLQMDKITIDGAGRVSLEPLNGSLGIIKRNVRDRPEAWRPYGYMITDTIDDKISRNKDLLKALPLVEQNLSAPCRKLQDYHAMMNFILEESGFKELQRKGFKWKLHYKGKTYDVIFRIVVPYLVGDTECHDRLCGQYTCRAGSVDYICRICETPTSHLGYSKANFPYRLPSKTTRLMKDQDLKALKEISMHYIPNNAMTSLVLGAQNNRGVHGACPPEILHVILLGHYKRLLEIFFDQVGSTTSKAYKDVTSLCIVMGRLLSRQSNRDLPRTNFTNGFSSAANLMGHEVPGCLVVLLMVLQCEDFAKIFADPRYNNEFKFGNENHRADWITLIEAYLEMEQWLKSEELPRREVSRLPRGVKWLMRQTKFIAPRNAGMNHRTVKFHFLLHLASDILDFGVLRNTDSSACESNHKPNSKDPANHTQMRRKTFIRQTASRYVENLTIAKAANLIKPPRKESPAGNEGLDIEISTGGAQFEVYRSKGADGLNVVCFEWFGEEAASIKLPNSLLIFINNHVLDKVEGERVICSTTHKRGEHIFRAHPSYFKRPWYDSAMFNWGGATKRGTC